jgi:hypothetical protein
MMEGVPQQLPPTVYSAPAEDTFVRQTESSAREVDKTRAAEKARSPETPEIRRPRPFPSLKNGWAGNIRVLASCGQDHNSLSNKYGSFYTTVLTQQMHLRQVGFQECHDSLEQSGFLNGIGDVVIFPTSTATASAAMGWSLQETGKERFALLIGALDPNEMRSEVLESDKIINQAIPQDIAAMEGVLKAPALYALPDSQVKTLIYAEWQDEFSEGIAWLKEKLRENPGAEGLVYYSGHQKAEILPKEALEGDALGEWPHMKTDEDELKKKFNQAFCVEQLKPRAGGGWECPPILFIVDSCSSGALTH